MRSHNKTKRVSFKALVLDCGTNPCWAGNIIYFRSEFMINTLL